MSQKKKVYEFECDYSSPAKIVSNLEDVLEWIKTDLENDSEGDEPREYKIGVKMMTDEEIDALLEFNG